MKRLYSSCIEAIRAHSLVIALLASFKGFEIQRYFEGTKLGSVSFCNGPASHGWRDQLVLLGGVGAGLKFVGQGGGRWTLSRAKRVTLRPARPKIDRTPYRFTSTTFGLSVECRAARTDAWSKSRSPLVR